MINKLSYEKQVIIMAQSSMRLAVDIAISLNKQIDFKFIQDTANNIMKIETALANLNIEPLKEVNTNSRKKDIEKNKKSIKNKETLLVFWKQLTEDEQVEYAEFYNKSYKEYA